MSLADEVVRPAAALMAVGFPQVVATLRPVPDRIGRLVAAVHTRIAAAGSAEHTAVMPQRAQRQLRDRRPERPSRWAAHAHYG
jgi:hypothetical protein